jgi:hypothetical protein
MKPARPYGRGSAVVRILQSATGPVALLVAVAIVVIAGALGAAIDAATGTQGWWIALGSLGLCFAALWLAAAATRPRRRGLGAAEPDWDEEVDEAPGDRPSVEDSGRETDDAHTSASERTAPLVAGGVPADESERRGSGLDPH